jgi:hypothetical protein
MDDDSEAIKSWADQVDAEDAKDVEQDEDFEANGVEHPSI